MERWYFRGDFLRSFRALHDSPLSSGPLRRLRRHLPRTRGRLPSQALRYSPLSHRALRTLCQLPRTRGSQEHARGCRVSSGKANLKNGFFCCNHTTKGAAFMPSQSRSARQLPRTRGSQNVTFRLGLPRLRDCAAEALPAAETAEAEQGQRSAFCEGAATPEAKAGHRNPGGRYKQCGGQPYSRPPQRDPIFRDAKVLLFWCDQQQKELLVRYFPFVVTVRG